MTKCQPLLNILYEAMTKPIGVIVTCENPLQLRSRLYVEQRKDPMLKSLAFVLSPTNPGSDLWIVKKGNSGAQE